MRIPSFIHSFRTKRILCVDVSTTHHALVGRGHYSVSRLLVQFGINKGKASTSVLPAKRKSVITSTQKGGSEKKKREAVFL